MSTAFLRLAATLLVSANASLGDNGCYEVYGTDDQGARAEPFFDPKTFERVDTRR